MGDRSAVPGPSMPPVGRSLFDFVTAGGVPFPFEALIRKIETDDRLRA